MTEYRPESLAGTNAPTRGDCDSYPAATSATVYICRNECPDQRGLRLADRTLYRTIRITLSRNECPDQRGLRHHLAAAFVDLSKSRNECPDQRGLRRWFLLLDPTSLVGPERMPRPEGIATLYRKPLSCCRCWAGTNAPTRGDCDWYPLSSFTTSLLGRNECPDQRGLRQFRGVLR